MNGPLLPLLAHPVSDDVFIRHRGRAISSREFLRRARALSATLPQTAHAINFCEERYSFLLVFVAMLLRGQVNLLPANRAPAELQDIAARYGNCPCIVERRHPELDIEQFVIGAESEAESTAGDEMPMIAAQQLCAIVFTSGSTGHSEPWQKTWGELYAGARLTARMLGLEEMPLTVVATVPPQHMFGLEMTIMLPLVLGLRLSSARPFFPGDLLDALAEVPEPRLLVSTPVHLAACLEEKFAWPAVARVVSATAPLSAGLARRAEAKMATRLLEIFGSTETGAIAFRHTSGETEWNLFDGLQLEPEANGDMRVRGVHLGDGVVLSDRVQSVRPGRFALLGRSEEMIKIAGKRVSLGDLNHKLQSIDGVEDGVFLETAAEDGTVSRLSALVVAPGLNRKQIIEALKPQIDPVFLPRPIHVVERLPRNEAGKLPRRALLELLERMK